MEGKKKRGMPKEVATEWNAVWREVLNLHGQWTVYIELFGNEGHVTLMQETLPDVFGLIQTALRHEITMAHGRLLDPPKSMGKDNMSVARLLETVKPHCPADLNGRLGKMLEHVRTHCAPMLQWRNKRVGHSDRQVALNLEADPLPNIERAEIEAGLEMLGGLVNEIDLYFNDRITPFEFALMRGTPGDLMQFIRDALDAREREMEEKYGYRRDRGDE